MNLPSDAYYAELAEQAQVRGQHVNRAAREVASVECIAHPSSKVMDAFKRGFTVELSEVETTALIALAGAPRFLPLTFGRQLVRLRNDGKADWAFRELAKMRGEEP